MQAVTGGFYLVIEGSRKSTTIMLNVEEIKMGYGDLKVATFVHTLNVQSKHVSYSSAFHFLFQMFSPDRFC